jgi:precorrin-2 dehydrogenase / sirohydrochlorin ferrochelatase
MAFAYPVSLEVAGRRCVVIGSDAVRAGKVEGLVAAGADHIVVLAREPAARLRELADLGGVTVEDRQWEPQDLDGAFLVVASAENRDEGADIAREAHARGALVNVMDDVEYCDWAAPSVVRRGELVLAVSTGGASPALAKALRRRLGSEFGEEWVEVLAVLRRIRDETNPLLPDLRVRAERWADALDLDEAPALVRASRSEELARTLRSKLLDEREEIRR